MAVTFTEGRELPREFTRGGGYERYGDSTQDGAAKIIDSISPWKLLEGIFVTKPAQERASQVAIAQAQADALANSQQIKSDNLETMLKYGAVGVGALVLVLLLTKRRGGSVAGYRRKRRRTNRSRR